MKKKQKSTEEENDIEIFNFTNSMDPYFLVKKRPKESGCFPCQTKAYKEEEEDNSCCLIY